MQLFYTKNIDFWELGHNTISDKTVSVCNDFGRTTIESVTQQSNGKKGLFQRRNTRTLRWQRYVGRIIPNSAGSISKFSISVRSLRNDTISMLIDFKELNIFRFRFESILTNMIFSISVLTSSISRFFDFSLQKGFFAE